MLRQKLLLR